MNPDLDSLQPYPFEKLAALKSGIVPPARQHPINLAIGEPRHMPPAFVAETLIAQLHGLANYPATRGEARLREAIAAWLAQRYDLPEGAIDPEAQVLPVNGTREALFAFAQCVVDRRQDPLVLMPNPFYQIYEGAALLAGAQPAYLPTSADTGWLPDLDAVPAATWRRCQLLYLCSPGNPSGAVAPLDQLQRALHLAHEYDFVVAADECYAEIYYDETTPPPGLLAAAHAMGNTGFSRCLVFHSLSKRSNLPGMRSGFVAGDAELVRKFLQYRTYHGCAMPPPVQAASRAAWNDEAHVQENRARYREKFDAVCAILAPVMKVEPPPASFYLWPETPVPDTQFARELYAREHVTVLPGSFLSREHEGINPGAGRVRIALVAELTECCEAAERIRRCIESL